MTIPEPQHRTTGPDSRARGALVLVQMLATIARLTVAGWFRRVGGRR